MRAGELAQQPRAIFSRYEGHQRVGNLCQWRAVGPAEWRRYRSSCGAHLPDQSAQPSRARTVRSAARIAAGLVVGRHIEGGLHGEDVDITNNSQRPVRFNLEIAILRRFRGHLRESRAMVSCDAVASPRLHGPTWAAGAADHLSRNRDFCREVIVPHRRRRRRARSECATGG